MLLGILCWISEVQIGSCNGLVLSGSWPIKDDQGPISLTIFDLNLNSIKKFMWSHPNSPVVLPTNFLTMTQQQCCGHMCKNLMWKAALIYFPINLYYDAKSFCDLEPCCHIYIGRLHGWSSFVIDTFANVLYLLMNGEMECLWCICRFVTLCLDDIFWPVDGHSTYLQFDGLT